MKFPVLISYAYARKDLDKFSLYADSPNVDVLLDCGAFTVKNTGGTIDLDDYCKFLDDWGDKIFRYIALDVVGEPDKTEENLNIMLNAGYKPVPVHVLGDDRRRMDYLFSISDYVALAGLRRPGRAHCPKSYIKAKMQWAAGRHLWLGYTKLSMIATFKPYSVDSSNWASGNMWGLMRVYVGGGKMLSFRYHNRQLAYSNRRVRKIINGLGFSGADFNNKEMWRNVTGNRSMLTEVNADSEVRYAIDVERKFGTRVFVATSLGSLETEMMLKGAIDRHVTD